MNTPIPNQIIREITPLSDKDCFYIAERYKTEFTYPIHNHSEFELNFTEKAAGVRLVYTHWSPHILIKIGRASCRERVYVLV